MNVWIVGNDRALTERLQKDCRRLGLNCAGIWPVCMLEDKAALPGASSGGAVLFSVPQLMDFHLALLAQLRAQYPGLLVIVVSAIPGYDTVLRAIRAGAHDFVDAEGDTGGELAEVFKRAKAKMAPPVAVSMRFVN